MESNQLNAIAQSGAMIAEYQALPEKSQWVIHVIKAVYFESNRFGLYPEGDGEMIEGSILRQFQYLKNVAPVETLNQIGRKWLQMENFDIMHIVKAAWRRFKSWEQKDIQRQIKAQTEIEKKKNSARYVESD